MGQKQGTGNRISGDRKVEPNPRIANPGGVSLLGGFSGNKTTSGGEMDPNITPLYGGKGYSAPAIRSITSRKGGSQGSY